MAISYGTAGTAGPGTGLVGCPQASDTRSAAPPATGHGRRRRSAARPLVGGELIGGRMSAVDLLAATVETLRVPAAIDLAAIVIGALTGGLLAAREGFAVSGVLLLAVSGGLGGGLVRDVLLAQGPPLALTNPAYLPTVAITAMVTFYFSGWLSRLTGLLVVLDAVTLGFFTVIGAQKAQLAALPSASVVFVGTVTAVGGAVIRDVLLAQRAEIVQPGPYNAVAALLGATVLTILAGPVGLDPISVAALVIVLVAALRVVSVWRGWEARVAVALPAGARHGLRRVRAVRPARWRRRDRR